MRDRERGITFPIVNAGPTSSGHSTKGDRTMGTSAESQAGVGQAIPTEMGKAGYKLAGADTPAALKGKIIFTRDSGGSLELMHKLVDEGKSETVARLAQQQYDIVVQRKLREAAESEEIAGILAGKVVEIDGEKLDFSSADDATRTDHALARLQKLADEYEHGSRALITGGKAKAGQAALERESGLKQAAAADPELAAKLAALGYTL